MISTGVGLLIEKNEPESGLSHKNGIYDDESSRFSKKNVCQLPGNSAEGCSAGNLHESTP